MTNKGTSVGVKKEQYNVIMYVKACTKESNLCSGISSYKINVDTKIINCRKCSNNCEVVAVYKNNNLIDHYGNRCQKGSLVKSNS